MPLLVHSVQISFGMHGESVKLSGEAYGKVGNVNHLLDFPVAFLLDLPHLQRYETPQIVFLVSQPVGDFPHQLTADGSRHNPPLQERFRGCFDDRLIIVFRALTNSGDDFPGSRIDRFKNFTIFCC